MNYWKKFLLYFATLLFVILLLEGVSEQFGQLFFFPMLAVAFFLGFYLFKHSEEGRVLWQHRESLVTTGKLAKASFAPDPLTIFKANRWLFIIYCFLFLIFTLFLWSYLTGGILYALRDVLYAGILFWSFIMYLLLAPDFFGLIEKIFPAELQKVFRNDWLEGYVLLLPITFVISVLFPYEDVKTLLMLKLTSFGSFFMLYTAFFLCTYGIVTMYEDIHHGENKPKKINLLQS